MPPAHMEVHRPDSLSEALEIRAAHPDALPMAGGTDLMVELNFDRARPPAVLDVTRIPELREWAPENGRVRVGAGVTYTRIMAELGDRLPGLAVASRTVGGNLATASPAGDGLPPLYTADAVVELASTRGTRSVPVAELITGPKRTALGTDELIVAFTLPAAAGPQEFAKVGTRNAMVISVCAVSLALWPEERRVASCIGSAGPTPIAASDADAFIAAELDWDGLAAPSDAALARFGALAGLAARPIDDVRGTADYRRHAVGVLARRTLTWAWGRMPAWS